MDHNALDPPSNVGLCVNPDETYCKVKAADGYTYYMAEALLDKVLASWQRKKEKRRTKFWKPIRVQIWNIRNTSLCSNARARLRRSRKRKAFSCSATAMLP